MRQKYDIKRFEPFSFLLALGFFSMFSIWIFALVKFWQNAKLGVIITPKPGFTLLVALLILCASFSVLVISKHLFLKQHFALFRRFFGGSMVLNIIFFAIQITSLPFEKTNGDATTLGYFYLAFLTGIHLLYMLLGLVAQGVMLARINERTDYLDSFIFSVNPPNLLNMQLLLRYMGFVTTLWILFIIFLYVI